MRVGSLFIRMYGVALILLVLLTGSLIFVVDIQDDPKSVEGLVRWITEDLYHDLNSENNEDLLVKFEKQVNAHVSFFTPAGELIARSPSGEEGGQQPNFKSSKKTKTIC